MTNAIFNLLVAINTIRKNFNLPPMGQYEFDTPAEWRREYKRVMNVYRSGECPWN